MLLIVKASNVNEAKQYALQRGLNTYKCNPLGDQSNNRFCVYTVDNADSLRIISQWHRDPTLDNCQPIVGFPEGTLLYYTEE